MGVFTFTFCLLYLHMLWTEAGWAPLLVWARWWIQGPSSGKDSTLVAGPIVSYSKHLHKHNAVCAPRITYFINDLLYLVSLEVTLSLGFQESGIHECTICDVWLCDHACRMAVFKQINLLSVHHSIIFITICVVLKNPQQACELVRRERQKLIRVLLPHTTVPQFVPYDINFYDTTGTQQEYILTKSIKIFNPLPLKDS